jgi:superfamily I DNA and/or RNA helicase
VYDGRLESAEANKNQVLVLAPGGDHGVLAPSGIRFVDVIHEGCSQESEEEALQLRTAFNSLASQSWTDRAGNTQHVGINDILVVTPYNMQVNLLKTMLPLGARVGTVDKIQGQEAAVVLISMATSSGDDLPRRIDFLYSRNRLNVAISRARCLAVVFASPRLLEITCKTVEEMKLVNTLCWVKVFADDQMRSLA